MSDQSRISRRSILKAVGVGAGASLGGVGALSEAANPASAGTDTTVGPGIIEDFEDGDLSEYTFDYGSSHASVGTTSVYNGSYGLEISDDNALLVRPEFPSAPSQGDIFSCQTQASGTPFGSILFGVQDVENFYSARIRYDIDKISILKKDSGSWSELTGKYLNFSMAQDTWYEMEVDWAEDGTQTFTVSGNGDSATLSCTDTQWSDGGIGYKGINGSGEHAQFDYTTKTQRTMEGIVIDDFEDGDLSEYTFDYGSSGASVTEAAAYTKDQALELSDTDIRMVDPDAGPTPGRGDTLSTRMQIADNDPWAVFMYGVKDLNNCYAVRIRPDIDKISILKQGGGSWSELTGKYLSFSITRGVWYEMEIDWQTDCVHTLTISGEGNSATTSCSDSTFSEGGIGFDHLVGSSGGTAYHDSVQIEPLVGNYETSMDGWSTTGSSTLTRKSGSEEPAAVTRDDNTLEVAISGESNPSIECQERVSPANCVETSYLLADVLPADVENSDSHVTFQFRYHHTDPGGVEESPEMTVEQAAGGVLAWDLSSLSQSKLESSDRIEISWYPTDHPPSSGFDYNGRVLIDNVRLSSDLNEYTEGAFFQKHRELELAYGMRTDQVIQSESGTTQEGVYRYYDGTEIPYRLEKLADGDFEETVDGDTYRWTRQ